MRVLTAMLLTALTMAPAAFADDDDDWRRSGRDGRGWGYDTDRDRDRHRYGNRDRYGDRDRYRNRGGSWERFGRSNRYDTSIVSRTISDLRVAASRNRVDSHEREHFRNAVSSLQQFEYELRSGRFNDDRLEDAMDDLRDLARADQVHPRDRQILGRDLAALNNLRYRR